MIYYKTVAVWDLVVHEIYEKLTIAQVVWHIEIIRRFGSNQVMLMTKYVYLRL